MKFKSGIFLFICFFGLSISACADDDVHHLVVKSTAQNNTAINEADLQRFEEALVVVKRYYVEDVPDKTLFDNALHGLLGGLDPHSAFLDEEELKDLKEATIGQFSGLGIELSPENGYLKVVTPLDDSPAQKAGIEAGDYIVQINNEFVKDMSLGEAIKKMRGPNGSSVMLTIVRSSLPRPLKIKVNREVIKVKSVKSKMLEPGYAYVRIGNFQEDTAANLKTSIKKLKQQTGGNLKGLVLDVRNNPGGLLEPAVDVVNAFLSAKQITHNAVIVSAKGHYPGSNFVIKAKPDDIIPNVPMVVLINAGSASGAEIVAGALQDYKRAVLIGTNSFGKGSVQTVIPLDDKSAIKLTTALYYTPNGRSIQASGIKPDVYIEAMKFSSKKAQSDDEKFYIKEADLKGHLANGNKQNAGAIDKAALAEFALSDKPSLASDDYQLSTALNVLKGLVAVQSN